MYIVFSLVVYVYISVYLCMSNNNNNNSMFFKWCNNNNNNNNNKIEIKIIIIIVCPPLSKSSLRKARRYGPKSTEEAG